jgi:hypothetical protein
LIDTVFANGTTRNIRMKWGDRNAATGSNGASVFKTTNGFSGVWHFDKLVGGQFANSCQSAFPAAQGTNPAQVSAGNGIAAGGAQFGNGAFLSMGAIPVGPTITMSAWVNLTNYTAWAKVLFKPQNTYLDPYMIYSLETVNPDPASIQFKVGFATLNQTTAVGTAALATNAWVFLVGTYDGATARLYINGILNASQPITGTPPANPRPVMMGGWDTMPQEYFDGVVDEARLCNSVWDAAFIRLCYESQKAGSTVVTITDR